MLPSLSFVLIPRDPQFPSLKRSHDVQPPWLTVPPAYAKLSTNPRGATSRHDVSFPQRNCSDGAIQPQRYILSHPQPDFCRRGWLPNTSSLSPKSVAAQRSNLTPPIRPLSPPKESLPTALYPTTPIQPLSPPPSQSLSDRAPCKCHRYKRFSRPQRTCCSNRASYKHLSSGSVGGRSSHPDGHGLGRHLPERVHRLLRAQSLLHRTLATEVRTFFVFEKCVFLLRVFGDC